VRSTSSLQHPITQGLTVDFSRRRLGQLREKLDLPGSSCWLSCAFVTTPRP